MRFYPLTAIICLMITSSAAVLAGEVEETFVPEQFPSPHSRPVLSAETSRIFPALFSLVNFSRRWDPGTDLKFCFFSDDAALANRIADTAKQWIKGANITFDFHDEKGNIRQCLASNDPDQVRIGFDCPNSWSLVGTESIDPQIGSPPSCAKSGQTMNLSQAGRVNVTDKAFARDVLHEMGHVLGFLHEHMKCEEEYDQPAMSEWLKKNYGMSDADIHLQFYMEKDPSRILGDNDLDRELDRDSIEIYSLPPFFFKLKTESKCFVAPLPYELSAGDLKAVDAAYPVSEEGLAARKLAAEAGLKRLRAAEMTTTAELLSSKLHLDMNIGGKNPTAQYSTNDASSDEKISPHRHAQSDASIAGRDPDTVKRVFSDLNTVRKIVELQGRQSK